MPPRYGSILRQSAIVFSRSIHRLLIYRRFDTARHHSASRTFSLDIREAELIFIGLSRVSPPEATGHFLLYHLSFCRFRATPLRLVEDDNLSLPLPSLCYCHGRAGGDDVPSISMTSRGCVEIRLEIGENGKKRPTTI